MDAARYRDVFAVAEFRAMFASHLLSIIGDQLARVALAVLVFHRTGSAALAALTYALTLVPELAGGPLLAGIGDRRPRRAVMITCDLLRAGLLAIMAIPGLPIWVLAVLLVAVQLVGAPFKAARAAIMPTVLPGDRFTVGSGVLYTSLQIGTLGGYAAGAPLVAWQGPEWALLLDAATFLGSAALLTTLGPHPPVARARRAGISLGTVTRLVWQDLRLRNLVLMACLGACYAVPSGLAVPYATQIGAGTAGVGLLLAAAPAGTAVGTVLLTRVVPPRVRPRLLGPLAVATSAVLLPVAFAPGLLVMVALCGICGLLASYDAVSAALFQRTVPDEMRGQAFGLVVPVFRAAQGLGIALGGVLAQLTTPASAIAVFAAIGVVAGSGVAAGWRRAHTAPLAV